MTLLPYLVIGLVLSAVTIYFRPGLHDPQARDQRSPRPLLMPAFLISDSTSFCLPRIGLVGAAIATTVSYAAIVVFLAYQSLRVLPYKIEVIALCPLRAHGECWCAGW